MGCQLNEPCHNVAAVFGQGSSCCDKSPLHDDYGLYSACPPDQFHNLGSQASSFESYNRAIDSQLSLASPLVLATACTIKTLELAYRVWHEPGSKLAECWLKVGYIQAKSALSGHSRHITKVDD